MPGDNDLQHPPTPLLTDDVIELRLIRVMTSDSQRPAHEQFLAGVPEVRYAIHLMSDGTRVGRIHLRVTTDPKVIDVIGHTGYAVDEAHRGNGYATRAIRLIIGLAKHWHVDSLWAFIEPDNVASRRAAERAGLALVDIVASAPEIMALGVGASACRYRR